MCHFLFYRKIYETDCDGHIQSCAISHITSYILSEILFLLTIRTDCNICLSVFLKKSIALVDSVKTGNDSQCVNVDYSRVWKPSSELFPG